LCRNLPDPSLTHASKQAFVAAWLTELLSSRAVFARASESAEVPDPQSDRGAHPDLAQAGRRQGLPAGLVCGRCRVPRGGQRPGCVFDFHPQAYAPSRDYDGRFGHFEFRKHYYGRIGDFDSAEEFACACWLDTQAQKGRLQFWVRNLVRREGCSFFLQKADGRFYPDFVCRLPDATTLAVEYKGADRWAAAEDDRLIGGLWAALSEGRCRFVMVREKGWDAIDALLP
jgi:type III restriction enzyme